MASTWPEARRSATLAACSIPSGPSSGSPWPSKRGKGVSGSQAIVSPWRTSTISLAPAGTSKRTWRWARVAGTAEAPSAVSLPSPASSTSIALMSAA